MILLWHSQINFCSNAHHSLEAEEDKRQNKQRSDGEGERLVHFQVWVSIGNTKELLVYLALYLLFFYTRCYRDDVQGAGRESCSPIGSLVLLNIEWSLHEDNYNQESIASQDSVHFGDSPVFTLHDNHSDKIQTLWFARSASTHTWKE